MAERRPANIQIFPATTNDDRKLLAELHANELRTADEIASATGMTVKAVNARLTRLRRRNLVETLRLKGRAYHRLPRGSGQ